MDSPFSRSCSVWVSCSESPFWGERMWLRCLLLPSRAVMRKATAWRSTSFRSITLNFQFPTYRYICMPTSCHQLCPLPLTRGTRHAAILGSLQVGFTCTQMAGEGSHRRGERLTCPTCSACQGIIQKLSAIHNEHTTAYSIMMSR